MKTIGEAVDKARDELKNPGNYSIEQIDQVTKFLYRDVFSNAHKATEAIKDALNPQRV